jgi:hypothetical protein
MRRTFDAAVSTTRFWLAAAFVFGGGAVLLVGCSTVLGLDRFDGARDALESEAGGTGADGSLVADSASSGEASDAGKAGDAGLDVAEDGSDNDGPVDNLDGGAPDTRSLDAGASDAGASDVQEASFPDANGQADADEGGATGDAAEAGTSNEGGEAGIAEGGVSGDARTDSMLPPVLSYTFDTGTQGWTVLWSNITDGGVQDCSLTWSSTVGDPSPGSLELKAPFHAPNEALNMGIYFPGGIDLSGRTLTLRIKLVSGLSSDPNHLGAVMPYFQDTGYTWADNGSTSVSDTAAGPDGWVTITANVDHPAGTVAAGYTPQSIYLVGIQFSTRGCGVPNACSPADIFIDSIVVQ